MGLFTLTDHLPALDRHGSAKQIQRRMGNPSRNSYCSRVAVSPRRGHAAGTAMGTCHWYSGNGDTTKKTSDFRHFAELAFSPVFFTSEHLRYEVTRVPSAAQDEADG